MWSPILLDLRFIGGSVTVVSLSRLQGQILAALGFASEANAQGTNVSQRMDALAPCCGPYWTGVVGSL